MVNFIISSLLLFYVAPSLPAINLTAAVDAVEAAAQAKEAAGRTLSTFDGVFMYVAVSIFGVVLFTRMGWMVAFGGIGISVLIVLIAAFVTLVTTSSVSALVNNGTVMSGGPYALVSFLCLSFHVFLQST